MEPIKQVELLLKEVKDISVARLKALGNAAKNANLEVIDKDRLKSLEAVFEACKEAFAKAKMTRDYKDVQLENYPYVGKKFLITFGV